MKFSSKEDQYRYNKLSEQVFGLRCSKCGEFFGMNSITSDGKGKQMHYSFSVCRENIRRKEDETNLVKQLQEMEKRQFAG